MTTNRPQIVWQEMRDRVTNPTFRHPRLTIASLLLALGMVLAGTPAAEARDAPKQTGPLNFENRECARKTVTKRVKINGVWRVEVVAKTETCLLIYEYDPLAEDNEERDYALTWVQARIEPKGAWCAKKVWSDLVVAEETRMHTRVPAKNFKLSRPRRVQMKLASTAGGAGEEKATLSEKTWLRPRRLRHSRFTFERQPVFRQVWTGQRGRTLDLTSGVEVSWRFDDPPDHLTSGILADFERRGRC